MAIVEDNIVLSATTASTVATSFALAAGSDRIVLVFACRENDITISSITFDGVSMTAVTNANASSTPNFVDCYYMLDTDLPAGGSSYDVVVNGPNSCFRGIMAYQGAKQEAPQDGDGATGATVSEVTSGTLTVAAAGSLLLSGISVGTSENFIAVTDQTLEAQSSSGGGSDAALYSKSISANGTIKGEIDTGTAGRFVMASTVIAPAAGTPAAVITVGPTVRKRTDTTTLIAATATE